MMQGQDSQSRTPRRRSTQRPNPASIRRRLKRNVRVGGRRTTIVLEAYVWDSIDFMLDREGVLRAPSAARPPVPLLQLALSRFAQDEARVE